MKEITFPTMVFIMVNILETKLYTCGLVDTGSEITIFKRFLLKEWKDTKIFIKGVTRNKEDITKQKENVEIMIHNKIIRRGKARMVINYKEVNKNTKFDGYYIPNKKILINLARGKYYYNKFDCKLGFWQTKMDNDSIPITAFSTPRGNYEWMVMSFGLKNAPHIFQRKMDKIFSNYSSFIIVYIDDMLICSDNEKYHEKHLNIFITLYKEHVIVLS